MTFGQPFVLAVGLAAALAVVALHFLARAEPPAWALPTARFVPASRDRAVSRAVAPRDLALLLLRLLAIAALTVAFARPALAVKSHWTATVVVADFSRAADRAVVRGEVERLLGEPGRRAPGAHRLVVLDTAARALPVDSLAAYASAPAPIARAARLSAALLRARAEAVDASREADSVRIVLVSPVAREEADLALRDVRRGWPGAIVVRRVAGARPDSLDHRVALRAAGDDPLRATLALDGRPVVAAGSADTGVVRVVRTGALTPTDTSFARDGGTLVHWPASVAGTDTTHALRTTGAVVVAPFVRDTSPDRLSPSNAVAHWVDGLPAADEAPLGAGCLRRVAVPVPGVGDLALRASFRLATRDLLAPCGGARDLRPASDSVIALLAGAGAAGRATAADELTRPAADATLVRLLLALALLALLAEWLLRRRLDRGDALAAEGA